ncbi:MBL fold metallo-hydrolase [Thalassotalea euphylliae]|uniref:MBL fold metallo-hydrolase n=1 Tax=Thalassotalea euphylliae TaxID=1655234 RepID=A0A3E0U1U2_9GAMM|nr:MBL fold metallo-hydrolase [Thalassotalea euphylliae]
MKFLININLPSMLAAFLMLMASGVASANSITAEQQAWLDKVNQHPWYAGSEDCTNDTQPAIETLKVNERTYIFRQNKCQHFEAPFIYLLLGDNKALLQDTGATESAKDFPLYQTVKGILNDFKQANQLDSYPLIVSHSHSHSDHRAGDSQFINKPEVVFIAPKVEAVRAFFKFTQPDTSLVNKADNNPNYVEQSAIQQSYLQLGNRRLIVMPIPGHQAESVAVYDPQTGWLLTGDTIYPGRLYIRDWPAFKTSIRLLYLFTQSQPISALMGTHIEMSTTKGKDFPMGSTYQPNELPLPLAPSLLNELNRELINLGDVAERKVLDKVIIYPLGEPSWWQKTLAWFIK